MVSFGQGRDAIENSRSQLIHRFPSGCLKAIEADQVVSNHRRTLLPPSSFQLTEVKLAKPAVGVGISDGERGRL
jgi:hypothetical protein